MGVPKGWRIGAAALAAAGWLSAVSAAEFTVVDADSDRPVVAVNGTIAAGDDLIFIEMVRDLEGALVVFQGPGGALNPGMNIGSVIATRGYETAVAPSAFCAGGCMLAWLGGATRRLDNDSAVELDLLGDGGGGTEPSPILDYLQRVDGRVRWDTLLAAGPLQRRDIAAAGIAVAGLQSVDLSALADMRDDGPAQSTALRLTDGRLWIVVESARHAETLSLDRFAGLIHNADPQVVRARNGFFATVLGPFAAETALQIHRRLTRSGTIPADSFLSDGARFVEAIN